MSVDLDNIRIKQLDITKLPQINLGVTELPKINIGLTELPDINFNAKIDPLEINTDSKLSSVSFVKTDSTLKSESKLSTDSKLLTDNKIDLALDVRVKELPQIDLQLGLRPMRFHFPLNYRLGFSLFGFKIFEFKTCGEGMVIAEDYHAKVSESCK